MLSKERASCRIRFQRKQEGQRPLGSLTVHKRREIGFCGSVWECITGLRILRVGENDIERPLGSLSPVCDINARKLTE